MTPPPAAPAPPSADLGAGPDAVAAAITVILVTYNSSRVLATALAPLAGLPHVTVVDNASTDGSAALAQRLLPQARVIASAENLGFGRANNLALAEVTTPFALLLNPDCVLQPGALAALLQATQRDPEAAMWGPKIYDAPGRIGLCYRPPFYAPQPRTLIDPDGDVCTEFLTGAAMLLNMRLMREVGFFDPWFFLYLEDDDLCLRARRAGHPLILVHEATALHHVRQSSPPSRQLTYRRALAMTLSKFYLERKLFGTRRCVASIARIGLGSLVAVPVLALSPQRDRWVHAAGRLVAALRAPWRLRADRCLPPTR